MKPNETGRGYDPAPKDSTGSFTTSGNKNLAATGANTADTQEPSAIVPDGFDAERLEQIRSQLSTTPPGQRPKCPDPECRSLKVHRKSKRAARRKHPEDWFCEICREHFDEPYRPGHTGVRGP